MEPYWGPASLVLCGIAYRAWKQSQATTADMDEELLRKLSFDAGTTGSSALVVAALREFGVVRLDNLFDQKMVRLWHDELLQQVNAGGLRHVRNRNIGRSEFNFDPTLAVFGKEGLFRSTLLVHVVRGVLGARCVVETGGFVRSESGAKEQRWHQDVPHLFAAGPHLPPHFIAVFVPAVDVDAANGPTEFRVGTHIRANVATVASEIAIPCSVGSAVIFDGRVFHRGQPNASDGDRDVIFVNLTRHWFRDVFNKLENMLGQTPYV